MKPFFVLVTGDSWNPANTRDFDRLEDAKKLAYPGNVIVLIGSDGREFLRWHVNESGLAMVYKDPCGREFLS